MEDKAELDPEKAKLIMFSGSIKETSSKPGLFLYGFQLSYVSHAKFLGVTSDHKFTFIKLLSAVRTGEGVGDHVPSTFGKRLLQLIIFHSSKNFFCHAPPYNFLPMAVLFEDILKRCQQKCDESNLSILRNVKYQNLDHKASETFNYLT